MEVKTYTKKDFLWTKWDAKTIKSFTPKILAYKKKVYAEIKKIKKEDRTFENTIYALESSDYLFGSQIMAIETLSMVSPIESVRNTTKNTIKKLGQKMVDIEHDKGLYNAVLEYRAGPNYKKEKLSEEEKKLLIDTIKEYRRMGFDLSEKKQKRLKEIFKRLSKLSNDFNNNINEYYDFILVTRNELNGLPERYINSLIKDKKTGKYKVTLEYPDIGPFMTHADNNEKRKELADKNLQKGGRENMKILREILKLRYEKAKLLGYKNHADYVTEMRMVKSGTNATRFVTRLASKLKKGTKHDILELTSLKREITGDKKSNLLYYDLSYYSEKLKEKKYNINTEKIREYFPFKKVIKGTFEIYQKLFGIKFEKLNNYPTWHKDVPVYRVKDNGKIISYFMLDLYPRKNKYGHACAQQIVSGRTETFHGDKYIAPLAVMIANFPKPRPDVPSLLDHREVETFFHEFGHIMHSVLTKSKYASQSGYHAVCDFVEAPSQMLENWTWNEKMIGLMSGHYKTKKPLPMSDLKNLLKIKNHLVCYSNTRQLAQSYFDLFIHTKLPTRPIERIGQDIIYNYTSIRQPKESIFPAGFGHLIGYDAGYYSYMWSLVYASDMFTRFKKEGLLNSKTGRDYRIWILEKGSSVEEIELVKKFLGRNPNNKAFLKEIGATR